MKIFGWVHRQFVHKGAKKDIDNYDQVVLLENEGFSGACDAWKEGILTIGTLGHDLFQDLKPKEDTFVCNQVLFVDDDDDHDEEMESPLVQKPSSNHGLDHQEDHVAKANKHQEDEVVVKDATNIMKSGKRTTLADLFRADSESDLFKNDELVNDRMIKVSYHSNSSSNSNSNNDNESMKSFLITKTKKKLGKDGLAQPFRKTKQLMRKILRKKIHPDIGNQKKGSPSVVSQEIDA
ncbi:protein TILLER ANGLE CONTROL 1-like [Bidens hawaiensis]|uniref:protein TILLER ANGLE CONTROL 1-like n=1 Tax=Bidens hawaiensis TaxID=980011 RepID=UPI00404B33BD